MSLVHGPGVYISLQYKSLDGAHDRKAGLAKVAIPLPLEYNQKFCLALGLGNATYKNKHFSNQVLIVLITVNFSGCTIHNFIVLGLILNLN